MWITVGETIFDKPNLIRQPEYFCATKAAIIKEQPPSTEAAALNKFYCERLGPKFNRRFQAANYWLWIGNSMTPTTGNMLRCGGRHWRQYDDELVATAHRALPYINETERDGLFHLIPAIVVFGNSPHEIRRALGNAVWRRIARNSRTRNARIMQAAVRARDGADAARARFVRLLDFPSGVLGGVIDAGSDELMAARIAPRKTPMSLTHTRLLIGDAKRMDVEVNPEWGYARLQHEHDAAAKNHQRRRYSDKPFATSWATANDRFGARLLTSPLDIATEGATQHHCVAAYSHEARRGDYAIVRIDGAERATAGYRLHDNGWRLEQVYGACNAAVSEACRAFALSIALQIPLQRKAAA
jgi:hypothetical protein